MEYMLRDDVNKTNSKNPKHICIHYFTTFLGENSNVNNVINALLCFALASMYRYSWLITLRFSIIFFG